jgi:2-polyprenyl-6-methoxyphenol hydroxylase-like FAD-dependent oxidoreductase
MDAIIIGAGIGGLTTALELHRVGIPCQIFEAQPEIKPLGVGINILPDAMGVFSDLGLQQQLETSGVIIKDESYFNRFGQLIFKESVEPSARHPWPQVAIHRGELQTILLDAVKQRIGESRVHVGWRCHRVEQDAKSATAYFHGPDSSDRSPQKGNVVIGCDGIHSAVRKQLHPNESEPLYSGINMWRGLTRSHPHLSGASLTRAGWLATGQIIIYPIKNSIDSDGRQLINWLAVIKTQKYEKRDWNRPGNIDDFIFAYEDWKFDWLDVPALVRNADVILEFPMVDLEPLERWSFGRISLLGDAAHPMYPRGANGARQAILDAADLAEALVSTKDEVEALQTYEARRLGPTSDIVRRNRTNPPDAILRETYERTSDKPFQNIDDVISNAELVSISQSYKNVVPAKN